VKVKNEEGVTAFEVKQREGGVDCEIEEGEEREREGATELCKGRISRRQRRRKPEWVLEQQGGGEVAGNVYKREGTPFRFA